MNNLTLCHELKKHVRRNPRSQSCDCGLKNFAIEDENTEASKAKFPLEMQSNSMFIYENKKFRRALEKIANGEGHYGAQAAEYKKIAKEALE